MGIAELALIAVVVVILGGMRSRRTQVDVSGWTRALQDVRAELTQTQAELDDQRRLVEELAERLDFAERRLAQQPPARPALPPQSPS